MPSDVAVIEIRQGPTGPAGSDASVTAANIAIAVAAASTKTTPVDADEVTLFDSAASNTLKRLSFANLFVWIKAKLDAGLSVAGAWAFSSTTRPTSAGTGTPAATSLLTRNDGDTRYGECLFAVKSADTSRSSTTTYADDNHLTIAIPTTGLWRIELFAFATAADATGGSKGQLAYSGTINTGGRNYIEYRAGSQGVQYPSTLAVNNLRAGGSGGFTASPFIISGTTNRSAGYGVSLLLDVTGTGTLSFQWAQNASSATATIFPAGCFLTARRVSS